MTIDPRTYRAAGAKLEPWIQLVWHDCCGNSGAPCLPWWLPLPTPMDLIQRACVSPCTLVDDTERLSRGVDHARYECVDDHRRDGQQKKA
jgi:hypothetical protein